MLLAAVGAGAMRGSSRVPWTGSTRVGGGRGRRRRNHQNTNAAIKARPTMPPITPPAIGPALDELELDAEVVDVGPVDVLVAEVEE